MKIKIETTKNEEKIDEMLREQLLTQNHFTLYDKDICPLFGAKPGVRASISFTIDDPVLAHNFGGILLHGYVDENTKQHCSFQKMVGISNVAVSLTQPKQIIIDKLKEYIAELERSDDL